MVRELWVTWSCAMVRLGARNGPEGSLTFLEVALRSLLASARKPIASSSVSVHRRRKVRHPRVGAHVL